MDDVEYLDNGNIVVRSRTKPTKGFATSPRPSPRDPEPDSPRYQWEEDFSSIFHIDHKSYDVVLSDARIAWNQIKGQASKKKKKKDGICTDVIQRGFISYKDIYACELKRQKKSSKIDSEGVVVGICLYTHERKNANQYQEKTLLLEHPSEELCVKWRSRIERIVASYPNRPRRLKVYIQPYAGKKNGRSVLKEKCESLFELARIEIVLKDILRPKHLKVYVKPTAGQKNGRLVFLKQVEPLFNLANILFEVKEIYLPNSLEDDIKKLDLTEYDGIVCVGGDGTANNVINALLNRCQREEGIEMKPGFNPVKLNIPVGIIPVGTTNHIAQTIMGTDDVTTAAFHIIYGNAIPVDLCSVYHKDKFDRWAFNGQYGFGGSILEFSSRYNILGQKRVDAAFLKALTKSKLRPYQCEVQFIPSPNSSQSNPLDGVACRTGCAICLRATPGSRRSSVYTDSLQEYDPLAISGTSSTIIDLTKESPWRTTKGEYMNVGLFTLPAMCDYAPQGLSKYTHLGDGCMDLVLVRNTERKDFIKYLKRHGSSKNQFEMPFVEVHRVKEVKFRPRSMATWKHHDHEFSEIEYELSRPQSRTLNAISEHSLDVVDELSLHDGSDIENLSDLEEEDNDGSSSRSMSACSSKASESRSLSGNNNDKQESGRLTNSAPVRRPRPLPSEVLSEKRKNKKRQKDERLKSKEQTKSKSIWNIDNSIVKDLDLDFRVHTQFIQLFGTGASPETPSEETKLGCLPSF